MKSLRLFSCGVFVVAIILGIYVMTPKSLEATVYGTIKGRAVDEKTGEGVKGVEVTLRDESIKPKGPDMRTYGPIRTDQEGQFTFQLIEEGKYSIGFNPPEPYIPDPFRDPLALRPEYPGDNRDIVTVEKGKIVYFSKVLRVGGTITGVVYKKANGILNPMKKREAYLSTSVNAEKYISYSAITDDNGRYKIAGLDPTYSIQLASYSPGFGPKYRDNITVAAGEIKPGINFVFDLDDKTGIEVTVVSSIDEGLLKNVHISIKHVISLNTTNSIADLYSDSYGKSSILNIDPGIYNILISVIYNEQVVDGNPENNIVVENGKTSNVLMTIDIPSK